MEVQEFNDPTVKKPFSVPLFVKTSLNKMAGLESTAAFDDNFFQNLPFELQNELKEKVDHLAGKDNLEGLHKAGVKSLRDAQGILGAIKQFVPHDVLHEMEFGQRKSVDAKTEELLEKSRKKDSKVKTPFDHRSFRETLQTPYFGQGENVRNFVNPLYGDEFMDYLFNKRGKGSLTPENINLYNADGSLFKLEDVKNSQLFDTYDEFRALQDRAMSPRAILLRRDPKFFEKNAEILDRIQSTKLKGKTLEAYKNEFITDDDPDLNFELEDPYKNNKINTVQVKANFHSMVAAGFWKEFSSEDAFAFMSQAYDNVSRFGNIAREAFGDFSSFIKMDGKVDVPDRGEAASGPLQQSLMDEEARLKARVDEWWDGVNSHLHDSMLSVYSLFGGLSQMMLNAMDWGRWDSGTGNIDVIKFREKMVDGYLGHVDKTFMSTFGSSEISADIFTGREAIEPNDVIDSLTERGIIHFDSNSQRLEVAPGVNLFDSSQEINLGLNPDDTAFVLDKLRKAAAGPVSFVSQDATRINGKTRSDMKVKGYDGNMRSLHEIMGLINKGQSPQEKAKNTKLAYDHLLNIHNSMTGLDTDGSRAKGDLVTEAVSTNGVTVKVSKDASWKEWHVERIKDGDTVRTNSYWKEKSGDMSITFDTREKAVQFKDNLRELIALLEPVAVVFGKHIDDQQLSILVDNSATSKYTQTITDQSAEYEMGVDHVIDPNFLNSKLFQHVSMHVQTRSVVEALNRGGSRSLVNELNRIQWDRDWQEYDEKEEEFYNEEIARIRRENRLRKEEKQKDKKQAQRTQKARQERKAEDKKLFERGRQRARERSAANNRASRKK